MAIKNVNTEGLSLLQDAYRRYWTMFNNMSFGHSEFSLNFKVHPIASIRSYQDYSIGHSYHIVLKINFEHKEIFVGAYFNNLGVYDEFYRKKDLIETDLSCKLLWKRHKTKGSAYIVKNLDFTMDCGWDLICNSMIENAILLKKAFEKYT